MGLVNDPTIQILQHVLQFHNRRHDLIATNIANSTTPGYRAFDMVLAREVGGSALQPSSSDSRHLAVDDALARSGGRLVRSDQPVRLDGNNVVLDQEFMKMQENRMMYEAAFALMDKWGALYPVARDLS